MFGIESILLLCLPLIFDVDVKTINHYKLLVNNIDDLYVGGIMASLMPEKIVEATGIDRSHILTGLFTDTLVVGDNNDINVDELPLDYDILEQVDYKYPAGDNYFAYTTRGCPNHCSFVRCLFWSHIFM